MITADVVQKTAGTIGYTGATLFAGMTLTDWDLLLRIAVGAITFVSILVHLIYKVRSERRKNGK